MGDCCTSIPPRQIHNGGILDNSVPVILLILEYLLHHYLKIVNTLDSSLFNSARRDYSVVTAIPLQIQSL